MNTQGRIAIVVEKDASKLSSQVLDLNSNIKNKPGFIKLDLKSWNFKKTEMLWQK